MFAPHVLPGARDYEALRRSFRWRIPANFNIGVDVCDRWAEREPRPHCPARRAPRRRGRGDQLRRIARNIEPACQRACRPRHRARRSRRNPAPADAGGRRQSYRHLQARRRRFAACDAVRGRGDLLPPQGFRRARADHQRAGPRKAQPAARRGARPRSHPVARRSGRRRAGFSRRAGARCFLLHPGGDRKRRRGPHGLHLRHDRTPQGRAACPSGAARASSRH